MWLPVGVVIPRGVRVAWSKRYPANLVVIKRNERDERRCISWGHVSTLRNPVPLISRIDPTTVVIGRVSPRLGRYPGHSVRMIVYPIALLIRRPALIHARSPCVAMPVNVLPIAVTIQVIPTRDVIVHILVSSVVAIWIVIKRIVEVRIVVHVT